MTKANKAFEVDGPAFINIISPCVPGWGYPMSKSLEMAKLAVETCFWPLYEVENDKWKLNYDPKDKKRPIVDWLKPQSRFKHLFRPENKALLDKIQAKVDYDWAELKKRCGV